MVLLVLREPMDYGGGVTEGMDRNIPNPMTLQERQTNVTDKVETLSHSIELELGYGHGGIPRKDTIPRHQYVASDTFFLNIDYCTFALC